ncbi:T9SS type A sorting domain-containing protein [Aureispira anguillae]|uniref:T9SS type A sorting domain-containing protein n=1 Tax=Aureispira anguillae TaxID=2864201 RepID=UPI00222E6490|nr:T9SS type A sorting domain-containing protein [Aureispira anguillae]
MKIVIGLAFLFTIDNSLLGQSNTIVYTYDMLNRVTRIEYPNGNIIEYSYQPNGNRITKTRFPLLPIELFEFEAEKGIEYLTINTYWVTKTELNGSHFEVEWSKNGGATFSKVGEVKAVGNSTSQQAYSFLHENPIIGHNYYRLKCVDLDGSFSYSKIRVVELLGNHVNPIIVFPNPTKDVVTIQCTALTTDAQLELMDESGKLISIRTMPKGSTTQKLSLEELPTGIYLLRLIINIEDEAVHTFKVEKVN